MKKSFSSQERDAFAKAVSAVEGLERSAEQALFFADFDRQNMCLDDQLKVLNARYTVRA